MNRSFFLCLAACRMRSNACDTLSRFCARHVLWLVRVPPGPRPSLHQLRHQLPGLGFVHHRLRLLVFPMRTNINTSLAKPEISRFPHKERPHMPGSPTTPGWAGTCDDAPVHVAFRDSDHVGTQNFLAFAAQWLAYVLLA